MSLSLSPSVGFPLRWGCDVCWWISVALCTYYMSVKCLSPACRCSYVRLIILMSVVSQESSESANTTIEDEDVRGRKVQTGSRAAWHLSYTLSSIQHSLLPLFYLTLLVGLCFVSGSFLTPPVAWMCCMLCSLLSFCCGVWLLHYCISCLSYFT